MEQEVNLLEQIKILGDLFDDIRIVAWQDGVWNCIWQEQKPLSIFSLSHFDLEQRRDLYDQCRQSGDKNLQMIEMEYDAVVLVVLLPNFLNQQNMCLEGINFLNQQWDLEAFIKRSALYQQLQDVSLKDDLTKLYNRRYINEILPRTVQQCKKHKRALTVAFVDIDYFKQINDDFGHMVGDEVLRQFAMILSQFNQNNLGWIARYGGDEFLICQMDLDEKQGIDLGNRIVGAVRQHKFLCNGLSIALTCSIGIYTIENWTDQIDEYTVIDSVDHRLLAAKKAGRDRANY